jgi:hypothetical protein
MCNSETLKFVCRRILPLTIIIIIAIIFLVITLVFPIFRLTFMDFTLFYWSFTIVSFILDYQAKRWTKHVVKHYGLQKEENPVMREMLASKDSKQYWIICLCICFLFFVLYIIGVNARVYLPFLFAPSWFLAIRIYDFLNDFLVVKKLKQSQNKL